MVCFNLDPDLLTAPFCIFCPVATTLGPLIVEPMADDKDFPFVPVCGNVLSSPIVPLMTDSNVLFYYSPQDGVTFSVHREHVGYFNDENVPQMSMLELMVTFAQKVGIETAQTTTLVELISQLKIANIIPGTCSDIEEAVAALINHASTEEIYRKHVVSDSGAENLSSQTEKNNWWTREWQQMPWVLLRDMCKRLAIEQYLEADHASLYTMCDMYVSACTSNFTDVSTAIEIFTPCVIPVRFYHKRESKIGANVYKGINTDSAPTWACASSVTSGHCDIDAWLTVLGHTRPTIFNSNKRPTLSDESIYTLSQTPHMVCDVQNLMEASLNGEKVPNEMLIVKSCERSDLIELMANNYLREVNTLAKDKRNCMWINDVTHCMLDPNEFNCPDGEDPSSVKSEKTWGKSPWRNIKELETDRYWQSLNFISYGNRALNNALNKLSAGAVTVTNSPGERHFKGFLFENSTVNQMMVYGVFSNTSKMNISEAADYVDQETVQDHKSKYPDSTQLQYKVTTINSETIRSLKYKLSVKPEPYPHSILTRVMTLKWCIITQYSVYTLAMMKNMESRLDDFKEYSYLRTDGKPFRYRELRGMVATMDKSQVQSCFVTVAKDTNSKDESAMMKMAAGFQDFGIRAMVPKCGVIKPAGYIKDNVRLDRYPWCELECAKMSESELMVADKRMIEIAEKKMYTQISSTLASMSNEKKTLYMRPHAYNVFSGILIDYFDVVSDKFTQAPCFPFVTLEAYVAPMVGGAARVTNLKCVWVHGPNKIKNNVTYGPRLLLMNSHNMYTDEFFNKGAGSFQDSVISLKMSERISEAVYMLKSRSEFSDANLVEFGIEDEQSKLAVVNELKEYGVEYVEVPRVSLPPSKRSQEETGEGQAAKRFKRAPPPEKEDDDDLMN